MLPELRKTEWIVLTGAPNSGKSSTIERLAFLGWRTVPESARIFINQELSAGKTIREIRADEFRFQQKIFEFNCEAARRFPAGETIFFDRGLGDSVGYFSLHGMDTRPALEAAQSIRYRKIFLLEHLKRMRDKLTGDEQIADRIEKELLRAYKNLGYDVIRVPAVSIAERAKIILHRVREA